MRSSRLVEIMLRLEGGRGTTASRLADALGVSIRTVYRDVAALSAAGVPLYTESGPGGGIRLLDGWHSRLSGMTDTETSALMLLGVPSVAEDLGFGDAASAAGTKLLGALPVPLRAGAQVWRERVYVDAPGWFRGREDGGALPTVASAALGGRRLRIEYTRGDDTSCRDLEPLGLVVKAGTWYLVARNRSRILSYRVSRIASATVLDDEVVRPTDFALGEWWDEHTARFDRSLLRYDCRVRLSPRGWRRLPDVVGIEASRVQPGEPDAQGWVSVDLRLESEEVAADQLIALGDGVEVLAPAALRVALRAVGEAVAHRHA
ncbi:YafY family transcriptional regulator [Rhodococcus triatomae]|uniref:Predicted DNA-binding transcriptional regulator YafY, contains an HTH and WYL domains n=1 Tax=Rhodococcus triatomae TaxID=300028 RepID=A0A1G8PIL2_9NOCA|nr:YafY family protein [Rhodococcus triatomae]QNG20098.1 YafY family transcriptional regulator [Rhodococcus triatomae]QNG23986.1 YafY family transcriptional regulator [Rhodococcus triatomae]SDI91660.1 Predicted DNA-binding transcriptional regulator YafY, contains an HTH and WYL domains [Rhodococcus triatomae]